MKITYYIGTFFILAEEYGVSYPFQKIERFLGGNDMTLANAEGGFSAVEWGGVKKNWEYQK